MRQNTTGVGTGSCSRLLDDLVLFLQLGRHDVGDVCFLSGLRVLLLDLLQGFLVGGNFLRNARELAVVLSCFLLLLGERLLVLGQLLA